MRIGMLADVYKPHVSGITNYISLNKQYLEAAGHEVYVFTFGDEDYADDEPHVVRSSGMPLLDTDYFISLRYKKAAQRLLQTMDVAHVHHPFLSGSLALRYCKPRGIPVIFTNHTRYDLYARAYIPALPTFIGETFLQAYLPSFCRACDMVITPSQGMCDVLRRFGVNSPIEVVPNGVDLTPYLHASRGETRQRLGLDDDRVVLIYTGRLGPEKSLDFLLEAFKLAIQKRPQLALVLVGDGPARASLHRLVTGLGLDDFVQFTGMIPYAEVPATLAMADAFVTASVTEVHPLSVIEAMAAGLPVLGIHSPGISDTVVDGETGYLASEQDLDQYASRMIKIAANPEARHRLGSKAQEAAREYAIETTLKLMEERYERVARLANRHKRALQMPWNRFFGKGRR